MFKEADELSLELESYITAAEKTANQLTIYTLESLIRKWHEDRNLIEGSTSKDQVLKLLEELGELSQAVVQADSYDTPEVPKALIADAIGDMLVIMINICMRNKMSLVSCMDYAYEEIKDRKGKLVNGLYIKEED